MVLWGDGLEPLGTYDAAGRPLPHAAGSRGAAEWVYREGRALHVLDALPDQPFSQRESFQALGLQSVFAAPIRDEEGVCGVLYLDSQRFSPPSPLAARLLSGAAELLQTFLANDQAR
jgi:GAF domain-containing protein